MLSPWASGALLLAPGPILGPYGPFLFGLALAYVSGCFLFAKAPVSLGWPWLYPKVVLVERHHGATWGRVTGAGALH